jgi:hypothetical protein
MEPNGSIFYFRRYTGKSFRLAARARGGAGHTPGYHPSACQDWLFTGATPFRIVKTFTVEHPEN